MYADMSTYGPQAFHGFGRGYLSRLPIIVLPAGVMCLAWARLLWSNGIRAIIFTVIGLLALNADVRSP